MQIFGTAMSTDLWYKDIFQLVQLLVALYSGFQEILGLLFLLFRMEYGQRREYHRVLGSTYTNGISFLYDPK